MFGLRGTEVFQIIVLLVLCHVGKNGPSLRAPETCDRHSSAIVRHVVHTKLQPVLDRYRVSMPQDCPFHPARDVLVWPERHAQSITDVWKCPVCGKSFFSEENLTQHFHSHQSSSSNLKRVISEGDRVCLGTYCDIMRCDVIERQLAATSSRKTSVAGTKAEEENEKKKNCDPATMAILENRCKVVVQQCTIGLLNVLSVKEYKNVEGELHRNICSFLNCEKYWDQDTRDSRAISPLLASVVGFILASGFFGCYYVVWVVFDYAPLSEESFLQKMPNGTTVRKMNPFRQRSAPLQQRFSGLTSRTYSRSSRMASPDVPYRRSYQNRMNPYGADHNSAAKGSRYHYERPLQSPLKDLKDLTNNSKDVKEFASVDTNSQGHTSQRRSRLSEFERENEESLYYPLKQTQSVVYPRPPLLHSTSQDSHYTAHHYDLNSSQKYSSLQNYPTSPSGHYDSSSSTHGQPYASAKQSQQKASTTHYNSVSFSQSQDSPQASSSRTHYNAATSAHYDLRSPLSRQYGQATDHYESASPSSHHNQYDMGNSFPHAHFDSTHSQGHYDSCHYHEQVADGR